VIEYWDWSANWASVVQQKEGIPYRDGTYKVFLSDYYDLTFGAYQVP